MLQSGVRLGPYEILGPLGTGGMGEVYRARDSRLDRDVAIKVVPPSVAGNPEAVARFERESRAVAALSHPNILAIYDVGQSNGHPYSVMELLEGETLGARIAHGPMPVRKAVDIAAQIARGLAAAHDKQIAHRDLKPENVFLTPTGGVKILDFGLARSTAEQSELTRVESPTMAPATTPGTVLGTVGYMSPEQVRGEPTDHRTDVFSLGCVLYEMLTGQRAYRRDTAAETMSAILRDDPPDPGTLNVNVPPAVLRTLRRCLEKRPQERFESARDLAFALESSVDSSSTSAGTALPPVRHRRWLGAATVALVLGTIIGVAGARVMRIGSIAALDSAGAQFRQLTFDRGTIRDGRFTPDGQSIVYGAAWNGQPLKIFRELKLERTRSALRPLWWLLGTELAIALGATVLLGGFLADHWHLARFAVPAIVLDVVAVLTIGSAAAQLRLLSSLDYAQPVVAIQSVLTELALRRVREVRWQWLLMLPLWTPFAIVVAQGIFGFDLYRWFGAGWVAANVVFGIACTPLMVWLARRLDAGRDGIVGGLLDDIAGRRMADAMGRLDEVAAFESEL